MAGKATLLDVVQCLKPEVGGVDPWINQNKTQLDINLLCPQACVHVGGLSPDVEQWQAYYFTVQPQLIYQIEFESFYSGGVN
jgi:hypothetical protein